MAGGARRVPCRAAAPDHRSGRYRAGIRRTAAHPRRSAPSLYDLRNLFQVNVEEGRHLWAMVYLLHAYFGRDGRDEAEQLLKRNSRRVDTPRILGAFNEKTTDWLQFFMFTYFTDRDGKYQLGTLKESAFDPLARTCQFMLKEEAHHMFVGTTGVQRTVERTAELMAHAQHRGDLRARRNTALGHSALSELSILDIDGPVRVGAVPNAAAYYTGGLKGRWQETRRKDDHVLADAAYPVRTVRRRPYHRGIGALSDALNSRSTRRVCRRLPKRCSPVESCARECRPPRATGTSRTKASTEDRQLRRSFHLTGGDVLTADDWHRREDDWLPTDEDRSRVAELMVAHYQPGEFASWIAPPKTGINDQPVEFDYVHLRDEALA